MVPVRMPDAYDWLARVHAVPMSALSPRDCNFTYRSIHGLTSRETPGSLFLSCIDNTVDVLVVTVSGSLVPVQSAPAPNWFPMLKPFLRNLLSGGPEFCQHVASQQSLQESPAPLDVDRQVPIGLNYPEEEGTLSAIKAAVLVLSEHDRERLLLYLTLLEDLRNGSSSPRRVCIDLFELLTEDMTEISGRSLGLILSWLSTALSDRRRHTRGHGNSSTARQQQQRTVPPATGQEPRPESGRVIHLD